MLLAATSKICAARRRSLGAALFVLALALIAVGCQGPGSPDAPAVDEASRMDPPPLQEAVQQASYEALPEGTVTFTEHVAPILYENCAICHRPGEVAPFSLLTYEDARERATQMAVLTKAGLMPPWQPETGYNDFLDERTLTAQEIGTLEQWADEGAPEGDPAALPPMPEWPEGWQLGQPDLVVAMEDLYEVPADGMDIFRIFVEPDIVPEGRFVRALEFEPGNAKVVHHAEFLFDNTRQSLRRDREDPEPGYEGMFAAGALMPGGHFLGWAPGQQAAALPDGMSFRMQADTDFVMQLHLLPTGKPEPLSPSLGFYFTDRAPIEVPFMIRLGTRVIDIPAGDDAYIVEGSYELPVDVEVISVFPHAHYLCREMKGYAILPDGTKRWLLYIKDWDFNWQDRYQYAERMSLPKGTVLAMQYTYDNSEENVRNPHNPPERVQFGGNSSDEMGDLWVQVLPRDTNDGALLVDSYKKHDLGVLIAHQEFVVQQDPTDAKARHVLGSQFRAVGRLDDAMGQLREAVRLDPEFASAYETIGSVMEDAGNFDAAVGAYRKAISVDPGDAGAHLRLALLFGTRNRMNEAIAELRQAIEIDPEYPQAYFHLGRALAFTGHPDDALDNFKEALRLEPDWVLTLNAVARLLATHPDPQRRDPQEAIRLAESALDRGQSAAVYATLAEAYASAKRFGDAARAAERALVLAEDPKLSAKLRQDLARYQLGQGT